MLILLTLYKLCAVGIRHIISTSDGKQVNRQVLVQGGTTQKYFSVNELLLSTNTSNKNG